MTSLRNAFFTGLLLLAPLVVTVWAVTYIISLVGGSVRPLYDRFLPESLSHVPFLWDVLATFIVFALISLLGYISRYFLGKYLLGLGERMLQAIPGVNTVYSSVKQIVATFSSEKRNLFSKVVLIEFPRPGMYAIAFLTNKAQGEPQARTAEEVWTLFVPTTPNPTSGFLVMLPKSKIVELDMSVGDGMKFVISGGAVVPPWSPDGKTLVTIQNPAAPK
ncbi:MAG: DUF502 domain-containing protein [Lacunisphaera sp.]|nr:DUF502 domain-containing protein [Lacunisphaera sp.]